MADTLVLMQLAHRTLGRLLSLLDVECSRLDSGHAADYARMTLIFEYLRDFPRTSLYPKERVALRRLEARDAEAASRAQQLLARRGSLDELTLRMSNLVNEVSKDGTSRLLELRHSLRSYVESYRDYLDTEARELFPQLRSSLSRSDWDLIDFQIFDQENPVYDEETENQLLELKQQIFQTQGPEDMPGATA